MTCEAKTAVLVGAAGNVVGRLPVKGRPNTVKRGERMFVHFSSALSGELIYVETAETLINGPMR